MATPLVLGVVLLFAGGGEGPKGAFAQGGAGAVAYVTGTGDIPLMPGLTMVPDSGMVFDTPHGRLVEAYARGSFSAKDVLSFYGATLPQMGWRAKGAGSFRREGEALDLEFLGKAPNLTVRFSLAPGR
ncbi:hypothetical protein [Rhodospirillum sp. A1_3_36]|uniref:hypothetical protein n=1 Tax=Rhodospirillum sp. A1_3_36 TaxID=3391666 RepID=UPI0039A4E1A4